MRQRALKFGVLSNPFRTVEPGEEFEHAERMNWAEPVEPDEPVKRGRRKQEQTDSAGDDEVI